MMEDTSIDSGMARLIFEKLGRNPVAVPVLWNYAKRNWDALLLRCSNGFYVDYTKDDFSV